uniref:DJ-1/PfpI domain-containing protein n=1 Tax=Amorphochlora amoebiformis TaxID=1561963 RepID=A0A7S0GX36_9EUKA
MSRILSQGGLQRPIGRLGGITVSRHFSSDAKSKNFAVVLSGCGVYDGSEITEAVATLVHLSRHGCNVSSFAPYQKQMHTIDHTSGEEIKQDRNVMVESARITRGNIQTLDMLDADMFDGVIFPGGFGAAKNLSTFASMGMDCGIHPKVKTIIENFHKAKKPMGFCCISPILAAKALGKTTYGLELTVGEDVEVDENGNKWPHYAAAEAIENFGATHVVTDMDSAHVDKENLIVTSPAYMCEAAPHKVFDNVGIMIEETLKLLK